jgi:hypothetical protein
MREKVKQKQKEQPLGISAWNLRLFGIAVITLVLGYVLLSIGPADSGWSLNIAPIVLIIGYCVLIPLAIFWKPKSQREQE